HRIAVAVMEPEGSGSRPHTAQSVAAVSASATDQERLSTMAQLRASPGGRNSGAIVRKLTAEHCRVLCAAMTLRAIVATSLPALDPWIEAWDDLACAAAKPYCAPGWALGWWEACAPRGATLRVVMAVE